MAHTSSSVRAAPAGRDGGGAVGRGRRESDRSRRRSLHRATRPSRGDRRINHQKDYADAEGGAAPRRPDGKFARRLGPEGRAVCRGRLRQDGSTWVYTNPQPFTYIRHAIIVELISGDDAVLKEGPDVGMQVATTGAPQLYGAEKGVGH